MFSPEAEEVLCVTKKPAIERFSLKTGKSLSTQAIGNFFTRPRFSTDQRRLYASDTFGERLVVYELGAKDPTYKVETDKSYLLEPLRSHEVLLWSDSQQVVAWDTQQQKASFKKSLTDFNVIQMRAFPDGKLFAAAGRRPAQPGKKAENGEVRLFETGNGKEISRFEVNGNFPFVSVSPDGDRIAVGATSRDLVEIYDVATKKLQSKLRLPAGEIAEVVFSPDSKRLAISRYGKALHVVDLTTKEVVEELQGVTTHGEPVFSRDGKKLLVSASDLAGKHWLCVYNLPQPRADHETVIMRPIATRPGAARPESRVPEAPNHR